MRVIVADDSLLTREGVAHLLESAGVEVVARTEDAESTIARVRQHRPDAVIIDIKMPPTHTDEGLRAAKTIRSDHPDVSVLVLSQYLEPSYAMRLLEDHPAKVGYLLKDRVFAGAVLVDSLRRLCEGETVVDPTIVSRLFKRPREHSDLDELTNREREVLALVAEGHSNLAIASQLSIAERTVEAHITQIFMKLGLEAAPTSHRRVLAVLRYLRHAS